MTEREFELSRRDLLRYAAQGAALLGTGGLLAACSSSTSATTTTTPATTTTPLPQPGGTLRAGLSGGSGRDTLDPHTWVNLVDGARVYSLFNPLVDFDLDAHPVLSLAEELTASSDAMRWTIRVKPDIEFHNGKTLSADDVLYSFRRIVNRKSPALGAVLLKALDIANAKKIDKLTVQIPCLTPFSPLKDILASYHFFVVPVAFDLKHPVGTGPFKFKSFTAGRQSTFVKNENYWEAGLPYIDKLVISDFRDEVSQVNALGSGTLDVIDLLSSYSIAAVRSGGNNVIITWGGGYTPFTMRVDQPPFDDVRVRQAFRLICDRQDMLDTVFSGNGKIGNDVFGLRDVVYDSALPQRVQDIEQAKSLLTKAGHSNLTVTLVTSPIGSGTVQTAQIMKQQAAEAGVTVNLKEVTSSQFFGPSYLNWTFAQDRWKYYPYFSNVAQATLARAPFNECHTDNAAYTSLYKQALATLDGHKRADIAHEMQQLEYSGAASGYIIPYFSPVIDGYASRVNGVVSSKTGLPLGAYGFKNMWLS
jgi:peptide/nickel transport system substrate-binding protein